MNKEFEALEIIGAEKLARGELIRNDDKLEPYVVILKQALTELKQIKEAKPSEAIEQIKTLRGFNSVELNNDKNINKSLDVIEQALLKAQEFEKVLEIIKKKWVNVAVLIHSKTVEEYNNNAHTPYNLTQDEFDTLKR